MNASIQDVAKAAHVSISTVSRSFTRPELVSAATREKVLRIAEELNFSTSRSAAALKTGHAMRVALLMSDHIRLWFSASVIEGLNQVLHAEGYDISIFQISSIEERRDFFEMLPVRRNADAVIVASFDADETEIAQLASANVPIIGINSVMPRELGFTAAVNIDDTQGSILAARHLINLGHRDIAYVRTNRDVFNSVMPRELGFTAAVNIDDTQGSILAARHLINLGHRDIAYVRTNRDVSLHFSVQQRFDSFMECCAGSGISPTVIVAQEGPDRIRRVLTDLMSLERMPTAIACQEDGIAVPLIFQLERSGYEVPNDISVIGYDNSFYANDIGLTTIAQDPIEMAKMAAEMTVKLIEGDEVPNDISVIGYDNSFYANDIGLTTIAQDPIEMAKMAAEMTVKLIEGEKPEHLFRMIPAELVVRSSTAKYIA